MTNAPQSAVRVLLLREVATGPVATTFVAERWTREGSSLAVVKVLRDPQPAAHIMTLHEQSLTLGTLNHRHIVGGSQLVDIDGHFGLISPYVDGMDLLDWMGILRENELAMPPRVVCEMLRGIAVALDAAMNRIPWGEEKPLGLYHGDLKPGNVMVDRDGELKVLDFCTGSSSISKVSGAENRSARTYMAPERRRGEPPSPAADIFALGMMGMELLGERWLHSIPQEPAAHDKQLSTIVKSFSFSMRSEADEQTLRSLLLKMVTHQPSSRPRAAVVAQTLRRLADRAPGPSLESFVHEHALPWLLNVPENPDTGLMVQVTPVEVELALPLKDGPQPEDDSNFIDPGDFGRIIKEGDESSDFYTDSRAWDTPDVSLSDHVADETARALEAARQARRLDLALDPDSTLSAYATDQLDGAELAPEDQPTEEIEVVDADVVFEPPPPPSRPTFVRPLMIVGALAMSIGALIAIGAILVGLTVGVYITMSF